MLPIVCFGCCATINTFVKAIFPVQYWYIILVNIFLKKSELSQGSTLTITRFQLVTILRNWQANFILIFALLDLIWWHDELQDR